MLACAKNRRAVHQDRLHEGFDATNFVQLRHMHNIANMHHAARGLQPASHLHVQNVLHKNLQRQASPLQLLHGTLQMVGPHQMLANEGLQHLIADTKCQVLSLQYA